jgi:hypothetical protein
MMDTGLWVLVTDGERARVVAPSEIEGAFHTVLWLGTIEGAHCPPPLRDQTVEDARRMLVRDLARRLDDEADARAYERLVLVAPGVLLNELRQELGSARGLLAGTVAREGGSPDDAALSPALADWWSAPAHAA